MPADTQLPLTSRPAEQRKQLTQGLYITLEGQSCTGKDVQLALLRELLSAEGYPVVTTKQPGGTPIGQGIRHTLLHPDLRAQFNPKAESLLYWADRIQVHEQVVKPALAAKSLVLGSRDFDSSIVYQSFARGLPREWLAQIQQLTIGNFKPHKTIILMIDEATFVTRTEARAAHSHLERGEVRVEDGQRQLFRHLREGFETIAEEDPHRFVIIDATRSIAEVFADVLAVIRQELQNVELAARQ